MGDSSCEVSTEIPVAADLRSPRIGGSVDQRIEPPWVRCHLLDCTPLHSSRSAGKMPRPTERALSLSSHLSVKQIQEGEGDAGAGGEVELAEDAADVAADGVDADVELLGDLLIGEALGEEDGHL